MKKILAFSGLVALFAASVAADKPPVNTDLLKKSLNPTSEIKNVRESVVPGLYEVQINNQIVYLSADGEKVISGDLYDLKQKVSHTDAAMKKIRQSALQTVADKDKIIYKAKDEKFKVSVFTDITCPYCVKLHEHMEAFNDKGITVEYLAFPRAGVGSKSQKDMQKVWCNENKTVALTQAKVKQQLPKASCEGSQTVEQFLLGRDIGINATPTLILSDGELLPGYVKPKELLQYLEAKQQPKTTAKDTTPNTTQDHKKS